MHMRMWLSIKDYIPTKNPPFMESFGIIYAGFIIGLFFQFIS